MHAPRIAEYSSDGSRARAEIYERAYPTYIILLQPYGRMHARSADMHASLAALAAVARAAAAGMPDDELAAASTYMGESHR